jgi:hypothetical protein
MKENLHVVFVYPESFPQQIIDDELREMNEKNLQFHVARQENSMYAAMEWIVPTFFATYFLKPYFEAFLQEAGKDHYELVKNASKKMLAKGKVIKSQLISASESTQKLSGNYTQSHTVSITFQTKTGRQVKMLFDDNLDLADWENAFDEFSGYILEHYEYFPNDNFSNQTKDLSPKQHYSIYVKINPNTKKLEFHDDNTLMQESRNRS